MKSRLFLLLISFFLISCQPKLIKMVDGFYESGTPERINYYSSIEKSQLLKMELFYKNGQLKLQGHFKNNLKHGQWVYYYEDGNLSDESWFLEGLLHGRSKSWYKNRKLRSSGFYQNGERVREWTFFNEEGQLKNRLNFSSY